MPEAPAPAYYAAHTTGWRRDVWALLHPPYTAWHLSYVLIGASLAPTVNIVRLIATLLAFFLAVGISAHALDELRGRPLQTRLPAGLLWAAAGIGLGGGSCDDDRWIPGFPGQAALAAPARASPRCCLLGGRRASSCSGHLALDLTPVSCVVL